MRRLILESLLAFRQNYWFWPSVLTVVAVLAGVGLPAIDRAVGSEWTQAADWLRAMQVDGARVMLTTLAGSVLGVAGVSFSITIVAVSFASGTYGPRLVGNFMRDRTNQVVLGVFLATFAYCIVVLRSVHAAEGSGGEDALASFVPQIALLVALWLTLVSIAALIYFIHHVPESINVMNLAAQIGRELGTSIAASIEAEDRAREDAADADAEAPRSGAPEGGAGGGVPGRGGVPETGSERSGEAALSAGLDAAGSEVEPDNVARLGAPYAGYVVRYDIEQLEEIARARNLHMRVVRRPGEFLVAGETLVTIWPPERFDGEAREEINDCVLVGTERTSVQDVLFLSDELVEIVGRALSPGVNDPRTAILCLDWLASGLAEFLGARLGLPEPDGAGSTRVLFERVTFERMLTRSFGTMRQYVAADRNATLHAIEVLASLGSRTRRAEWRAVIVETMEEIATSAGEMLPESVARREVELAMEDALARVRSGEGAADPGAPSMDAGSDVSPAPRARTES